MIDVFDIFAFVVIGLCLALTRADWSASRQRSEIDVLQSLNRLHAEARADDRRLNARIESFELAFRVQTEAPAVFDL
jgi:Protein of unknown function (DUF1501)